jgi:hypothetical protein
MGLLKFEYKAGFRFKGGEITGEGCTFKLLELLPLSFVKLLTVTWGGGICLFSLLEEFIYNKRMIKLQPLN